MIKFKDRKATNINRRKIKVIEPPVLDANGEIKEMIVDIERYSEGYVSEVGTALSVTGLTNALKPLVDTIDFLLKPYYSLANSNTISWVQVPGSLQSATLRINTPIQKMYAKVDGYIITLLTATTDSYSTYINITIKETSSLNGSTGSAGSTKEYNFYIKLYSDYACTNYITQIAGKVKYTIVTQAPLD